MTFKEKIGRSQELIREYLDKYPNSPTAISWGKDSLVLLDLVYRVNPKAKFFGVLSNTEFSEVLKLRDYVCKKYNLNYEEVVYQNPPDVKMEDCCRTRKVEAFKGFLKNYDCWFSGIRRDEGTTRTDFQEVEVRGGLTKVNPIVCFTITDIYRYLWSNEVPVNPLYLDYKSLSCSNCSTPEMDENESERAGRWKGTNCAGGECGIHSQTLK